MIDSPITTKNPEENYETKKAELILNFNNNVYHISLFRINNNIIRLNLKSESELIQYEKEFSQYDLMELNKNFRIYDNIDEIEADLISYLNQKKIEIKGIKETEAILKLTILATKDNTINLVLTKKSINDTDKINLLMNELEQKDKKINQLENKLKETNKLINSLQEEIKKINNKFESLHTSKNDENIVENKNKSKDLLKIEKSIEYLQYYFNILIPSDFSQIQSLYDIYSIPNSKNKIHLLDHEIMIYDEKNELIKFIGTKNRKCSLCVIDDNLIAYGDGKKIKFIDLSDKSSLYTGKKACSYDIYKIIKGLNENEIIVSERNITFWERNEEEKKYYPIENKYILVPNKSYDNINILLVDNILVAGTDKLYFFDLANITLNLKNKKEKNSEDENSDSENSNNTDNSIGSGDLDSIEDSKISSFKFKPNNYNSMILLDKKIRLFAVSGIISCSDEKEIKKIEILDSHQNSDVSCHITMLGEPGVGISSLIKNANSLVKSDYSEHSFMNIKINDIIIFVDIHKNISEEYYSKNENICVLVYSINNEESFKNLKFILNQIRKRNEKCKIFLVGNKSDLENERVVSKKMGIKFKEENNLEAFVETSAKTGDIINLINEMVKCFYKNNDIFFPKACVLRINDIDQIELEKYFYEKNTAISAFNNHYLLMGLENGNINIYDITKKYDLVKTVQKAHKEIYFIKQISDEGFCFVSYGEDEYLKVWSVNLINKIKNN